MDGKNIYDDSAYAWGQVFRIINRNIRGGLSPKEIGDASINPKETFATIMKQEHAIKMLDDVHQRIGVALGAVNPAQGQLSTESQSEWWLGFYHRPADEKTTKAGPPLQENRVDWTSVDWSKPNAVLARELGVSRQRVSAARNQYAKKE